VFDPDTGLQLDVQLAALVRVLGDGLQLFRSLSWPIRSSALKQPTPRRS
jgi:hypothetical protein